MTRTAPALVLSLAVAIACGPPAPLLFDPTAVREELIGARGGPAIVEIAGRLAAIGSPAVPTLVAWLEDPERNVREGAAHALGNLAPRTIEVATALARRIEDPDDYVRWKVIRALGRQREAARDALPALRRIARAELETEIVRASAQRAVLEIEETP